MAVVVYVYNLPLNMCMMLSYMFMSCAMPSLYNPNNKIDVYLQSLIDELNTCGMKALICMMFTPIKH